MTFHFDCVCKCRSLHDRAFKNITDNAVQNRTARAADRRFVRRIWHELPAYRYSSGQKELITVAAIQGNIDQRSSGSRSPPDFRHLRALSRMSLVYQPGSDRLARNRRTFVFQYEDLPFTFHDEPYL